MKRQLAVAWGEFLSQFSWDWFVTLTFRDYVKSFRAHRLFGYFVRDIEKAAGQPIIWFRADEIGPQGGRFHMHGLIGNVSHLRRLYWMDYWKELAGYARILPFELKRGAPFYCAKYLTKQNGDWEMSDNLTAFSVRQPALPLHGAKKPPRVPQQQQAVVHPPKEHRQFPLPYTSPKILPTREASISEVYRSEVTRIRGRYREFFPPGGRRTW